MCRPFQSIIFVAIGITGVFLRPCWGTARILDDFLSDLSPSTLEVERNKELATTEGEPPLVLLRFSLDVTGDGKEEIFLGSSVQKDSSIDWTVYSIETREGLKIPRRMAEAVRLPVNGFYLQKSNVTTLRAYQRGEDLLYHVFEYSFQPDGTCVAKQSAPQERDRIFLRRGKTTHQDFGLMYRPRLEKILMQDYLRGGEAPWEGYNTDASPHTQYAYSSDIALAKQLSSKDEIEVEAAAEAHASQVFKVAARAAALSIELEPESVVTSRLGGIVPALAVTLILCIGVVFFRHGNSR